MNRLPNDAPERAAAPHGGRAAPAAEGGRDGPHPGDAQPRGKPFWSGFLVDRRTLERAQREVGRDGHPARA